MDEQRTGRKRRGERAPLTTRWPVADREFIKAESDKMGISESSYTIYAFNTALNRPVPPWLLAEISAASRNKSNPGEQPMARSA